MSSSNLRNLREIAGSRSLAWIDREFLRFDPFQGCVKTPPDEASQTAICEFALLTLLLKQQERFYHDVRTTKWLKYLVSSYLRPAFHTFVYNGPPLSFTGHLILWLAVTSQLEKFPISKEDIQHLLDLGKVTSAKRAHYRTIELSYFLDLGRFRYRLPSNETLFNQCLLAHLPGNLDVVTEDDLYEATHVVFYMTDFGRRMPRFLDSNTVRRIKEFVSSFVDIMVNNQHWDLVAELLLTLQCLSSRETPVLLKGWNALFQAQTESGAVLAGPYGSTKELVSEYGIKRSHFLAVYHRSLTIAFAAYFGRGRENQIGHSRP